jgi:hypothetical protein
MSPAMSVQAQLDYENRVKIRNAAIAVIAALLLVSSVVMGLSGPQTKIGELTQSLITEHKRGSYDILGALASGIGYLFLAFVLDFLFRISRFRRPETQGFIRWLVIGGATLAFIGGVSYHVIFLSDANKFVSHGLQTYQQANSLTKGGTFLAVGLILNLGGLLLTAGFVWTSLNAMRVGLLPRPMGYMGILSGIFVLFPVGFIAPFVQAGWLIAIAYIFTGHWTSGLPKAWTSGEAEPWPSSAEVRAARAGGAAPKARQTRAERVQEAKEKAAQRKSAKATVVTTPDDGDTAATDNGSTATATPAGGAKRKRKRRR